MYNIINDIVTPTSSIDAWMSTYGDQHLEYSHDQSMMTLANPDDAIMVVGPPRLSLAKDADFAVIGFMSNLQYVESAQIQPMKAIGSRRHVFSKTNAPVNGSIARMMILGKNILSTLMSKTDVSMLDSSIGKWATAGYDNAAWFANLEEDVFRIPFGLGVIYSSPANRIDSGGGTAIGADYIECCVLQSKQNSVMAGQTMIMEQVTFIADRVMVWTSDYTTSITRTTLNPMAEL